MIPAFLHGAGWGDARSTPLAGDASARRYTRLDRGGETAILMHDIDGDVNLFARLARHLCSIGLSAPRILAAQPDDGLLLIEDLGDALFARLTQDDPAQEGPLYLAATDTLLALHRQPPPPGLNPATPARLAQMVDLAFDCYVVQAVGPASPEARHTCQILLADALGAHAPDTDVMILRDFHAENLIWLPDRHAAARTGLLDFQDALYGHRGYDLASLLRDVRRDVSPGTSEAAIRHYVTHGAVSDARFRAALAVLGVQRNLRILGVFARLAAQGKPRYLTLLPRVWRHLQADLAHPALTECARHLAPVLPAPTPAVIDRLRSACPTP